MVIHNLDNGRAGSVLLPLKTTPSLIIDADTVLPGTIAPQRFQPIARQAAQIAQAGGGRQNFQSLVGLPIKTGEGRHALVRRELRRSFIAKAQYHGSTVHAFTYDVKRLATVPFSPPPTKRTAIR